MGLPPVIIGAYMPPLLGTPPPQGSLGLPPPGRMPLCSHLFFLPRWVSFGQTAGGLMLTKLAVPGSIPVTGTSALFRSCVW